MRRNTFVMAMTACWAVFALGFAVSKAQPLDTLWTRTFGGGGADVGYSVKQCADGGFVVSGYTYSFGAGATDIYLVKTDASGNPTWSRTFGGSSFDASTCVQQAGDGGFILAGYTYSYGAGSSDVCLVKTDSEGNLTWSHTYGESNNEFGTGVQQTTDGGYVICGYAYTGAAGLESVYLIKTDSTGNMVWNRTFGGSNNDYGHSVQQTTDGGYIVAGTTMSVGGGYWDFYLVKTDSVGNLMWSRNYGGDTYDEGYSVQQTNDGGYIIAGSTLSYGAGRWDAYLIKTDADGDTIWTRTVGGANNDYGYSVQETMSGDYVVAGWTSSYGVDAFDVYLFKTDTNGNLMWSRTFGGNAEDKGYCVRQTANGDYIVVGETNSSGAGESDVWLIRVEGEPAVAVSLIPHTLPIIIPASGGDFSFTIAVSNSQSNPVNCDVWCEARLPNGRIFGPAMGPANTMISGGTTISLDRMQSVPANAPPGSYLYNAYIGIYPSTRWSSDAFPFEKSASGESDFRISDWQNDELDTEAGNRILEIPSDLILYPPHPNPFNSTTVLSFDLPVASFVKLEVFDINGRNVGAHGVRPSGSETTPTMEMWFPSGIHRLPLDGAGLPSGIYLAKLSAGTWSAVQKLVLMK